MQLPQIAPPQSFQLGLPPDHHLPPDSHFCNSDSEDGEPIVAVRAPRNTPTARIDNLSSIGALDTNSMASHSTMIGPFGVQMSSDANTMTQQYFNTFNKNL